MASEMVTSSPVAQQILQLLQGGKDREDIEQQLLTEGHDPRFVTQILEETIKLRNAKSRATGLALILGGSLVCFASFVLSLTSSYTHLNVPMVLYGLTSAGIVLAFAGFVKVF
jgi:hypothetical protein